MKGLLALLGLILVGASGHSQDILRALQLKEDLIGPYVAGEMRPSDTITDLRNGYYEEFSAPEGGPRRTTRQAALYENRDGSSTLGISVTSWDFVCLVGATEFYEIPVSGDSIYARTNEAILPELGIGDFLKDTVVLSILEEYLPAMRERYPGTVTTTEDFLSELYQIVYLQPRRGTRLQATLRVCDYIPVNEVRMRPGEWASIQRGFAPLELMYDRKRKKFSVRRTGRTPHPAEGG